MLFLSFSKPVKVGRDLISCSSPAEQLLYLVRGPVQKNRVKQIVGLAGSGV